MDPFDGDESSARIQAALSTPARDNTRSLFRLFDSLIGFGYTTLDLFEVSSPGASEALRTWALTRNLQVTERAVTPPGAPAMFQLKVSLPSPVAANSDGVQITVLRNAEAA